MRKNRFINKKKQTESRPTTTSNGPSLIGSIGHGMATGFGVGTGIEGARAVFGGSGSNKDTQSDNKCSFEKEQLQKCLNEGNECKDFIDLLNNCYKSN